jgi:uncharacterized membrane protein
MGTEVKKLRKEVRAIQEENQAIQRSQLVAVSQYRAGILPPPDELERYEQIEPGITNRLLQTFEDQVKHRIDIEKTVIEGDSKRANRGQVFAFIIVMVVLGISVFLMMNGYSISGLVSLFVGVGSLASIFIGTSINRAEERKRKRERDNK